MVCRTIPYEQFYEKSTKNGLLKINRPLPDGWILSENQMDFLRNKPYMYNCYVSSVMELLFLQKFWYFISRFVPPFISPCTITCSGLLVNVFCCGILLYYSSDAKQTIPNWTFFVCAVGLFIYQLFDALDGKQAVKVQDTPIEEVYDHGCDAVSALLMTQSIAIATRLGYQPFMQFVFFLSPLIAFYMTHFSCHVTHVMVFGRIDVIEGQWAMIIILLLTSIYGQSIWSFEIFGGITITHILFVLTIIAFVNSIVNNFSLILGSDSPMDKYIRIPRKTKKAKWNPFYSLIIITILAINGYLSGMFESNSILFIFTYGLVYAKLSFKLQIMNVTHEKMSKLDSSTVGPIILTIISNTELIDMKIAMIMSLLFAISDISTYFILSSYDMKLSLDLNIFSLKYPVGHEKCRNKNHGFNVNGTENQNAFKNIDKNKELLNIIYND